MNLPDFVKIISLPTGVVAPKRLTFEDLVARPLTRQDIKDDLEGVNSSIEIIRKTRGGSWPSGQISEEEDLLDLAWHEHEFLHNSSFAYVIYNTDGQYIGCFYLYGMGIRSDLTEKLANYDIDASWWVTTTAYEKGYYQKLYKSLQLWLGNDFAFKKIHYSNKEIPEN